jgi:hypothetical protein
VGLGVARATAVESRGWASGRRFLLRPSKEVIPV